ncbi:hypothetical protein [Priestia koreensis]|nr:hypothetical protein [Priestia koreensis]
MNNWATSTKIKENEVLPLRTSMDGSAANSIEEVREKEDEMDGK